MGWFFNTNEQTKENFIKELTDNYTMDDGTEIRTIAKSLRGNHLWVIKENSKTEQREIVLYLLSSHNKCWGYKPISECSGPGYYDCPKYFLDLQPKIYGEYAKDWRDSVRNRK